jgi:glycopeptide antibiotics resistance protein
MSKTGQWGIGLVLVAGLGLCLFLAWRPSPFMRELAFIPPGLAQWADAQSNLRTAIPFIGLGFVGMLLAGGSWRKALVFSLGLCLFSALLEVGQYFIATRHANWEDFAFGCVGAMVGMVFALPVFLYQKRQRYYRDSCQV